MDADAPPPPPPAPRPPTTLLDLPPDIVALILSKIPCSARFAGLPLTCKALHLASCPPSLAWREVDLHCGAEGADAVIKLLARGGGTAVRALRLRNMDAPDSLSADGGARDKDVAVWRQASPSFRAAEGAIIACAPYLEDLALDGPSSSAWFAAVLARAGRLTALRTGAGGGVAVEGLPGLRADAPAVRALLAAMAGCVWEDVAAEPWEVEAAHPTRRPRAGVVGEAGGGASDVHRAACGAAAAAAGPLRLARLAGVQVSDAAASVARARALLGGAGRGVTRLAMHVSRPRPDDSPGTGAAAVAALVAGLPALADLALALGERWAERFRGAGAVDLDLRPAAGGAPAVTRLSLRAGSTGMHGDLLLPHCMAARLACLEVGPHAAAAAHPPRCLRRPADGAWSRLTRLVYSGLLSCAERRAPPPVNLAAWGHAADFHLPVLEHLEVRTRSAFTLDGYVGGPTWAASVATRSLPRLGRLVLAQVPPERSDEDFGFFACSPGLGQRVTVRAPDEEDDDEDENAFGPRSCQGCGRAPGACVGAEAVREAVEVGLPQAAAADGGRRLVVSVVIHEHTEADADTLVLGYE